MVTMAPELDKKASVIQELTSRGIIVSIGHSNATYEQVCSAVQQGATMVTHLFNAISTPHHRSPGIFGVLGAQDGLVRPCYGIIADDIHVHPSFIKVAYDAHPDGAILVSDAMSMLGLPDGKYHWTNGDYIVKKGGKLTLQDTATIAGRCGTPSLRTGNSGSGLTFPQLRHAVGMFKQLYQLDQCFHCLLYSNCHRNPSQNAGA
jgi:N-acetylglucosamine-6-phosphate deacetylase